MPMLVNVSDIQKLILKYIVNRVKIDLNVIIYVNAILQQNKLIKK